MALDISKYDARGYPTLAVEDGYARWAELYDDQLDGRIEIALFDRIARVDWRATRTALDLACGTGRIGQWLHRRGVGVIDGVDLTAEMLARAEARSIYRRLLREDLCATTLPDAHADLIVNCMAIGHVRDLAQAYGEADRLLQPRGSFVLVGYHSFFLLSGVPTHFKDKAGVNCSIQNYIHLMSDHVGVALGLGWSLVEMHERVVDEEWVSQVPNWQRHAGKPVSFAMVWRKPG